MQHDNREEIVNGIEKTQENRFHIFNMHDGGIMVLLGFHWERLGREELCAESQSVKCLRLFK